MAELAEEACEDAFNRCRTTKKLSEAENAGVIAILDAPGLLMRDYRMNRHEPACRHDDESADVEVLRPIEPLDEVLLGTAIAGYSGPSDVEGLDMPWGDFFYRRLLMRYRAEQDAVEEEYERVA